MQRVGDDVSSDGAQIKVVDASFNLRAFFVRSTALEDADEPVHYVARSVPSFMMVCGRFHPHTLPESAQELHLNGLHVNI